MHQVIATLKLDLEADNELVKEINQYQLKLRLKQQVLLAVQSRGGGARSGALATRFPRSRLSSPDTDLLRRRSHPNSLPSST